MKGAQRQASTSPGVAKQGREPVTRTQTNVLFLATSKLEPVQQLRRVGRFPAMVTQIRRGSELKRDVVSAVQQKAFNVTQAERFYETCLGLVASAERDMRAARQALHDDPDWQLAIAKK